jgi:predicted acetyltransferase
MRDTIYHRSDIVNLSQRSEKMSFEFLETDDLKENELTLDLRDKKPADPSRERVPAYIFDMRIEGVDEPVGYIDLRIGETRNLILYGGHVGYGVNEQWRGRGLAARSCKLLFRLAIKHGINTLWITCRPDNLASSKTCEKAGGKYVDVVELPLDHEMRAQEGRTHSKRYRFDLVK